MALRLFIAATVGALALTVSPLAAHAFGQRYDLPIPLNYFLVGAVATVFLSFVLIGLFVQRHPGKFGYPRLNLLRASLKLDMRIGTILFSSILSAVVRAVSVLMFLLLLVVGFFGTDRAIENLTPTFIWIIWWVGMGYVVALVGNVWVFINPWKITFEWYRRLRGFFVKSDEPEDPPFTYPEGLGVWPALLLFFLFAWAENVYTGAFRPFTLSVMVLLYSIVMWVGMAGFRKARLAQKRRGVHRALRVLLALLSHGGASDESGRVPGLHLRVSAGGGQAAAAKVRGLLRLLRVRRSLRTGSSTCDRSPWDLLCRNMCLWRPQRL